jgi:SAM-dependent methyltransferase
MADPFVHYLAAKKSVDDRALNRHVWESLADAVQALALDRPLQVLEVGAGIGTMVERLLDWNLWPADLHVRGIDSAPENIEEARRRLAAWGRDRAWSVVETAGGLALSASERRVVVDLEVADVFAFAASSGEQRAWDVLLANAFPSALPHLLGLLRPGGLFYFTITFDGVTAFEPAIDPAFDALIEAVYHQTMDRRLVDGRPSGDSRAGRHLFAHLNAAGAALLDAGGSDWVVFPRSDGYPDDEAAFLHFIVDTVHTALAGHPQIDAEQFEGWIARRHAQIDRAELVYITHQLDLAGIAPASA